MKILLKVILFSSFAFWSCFGVEAQTDEQSGSNALPTTLRFRNYGIDSGLPGGFVQAIAQDSQGLMWFGDEGDGLVSFDGRKFDVFSHREEDSTSLSSNRILCMLSDDADNLWIGTDHGLNQKIVGPLHYLNDHFIRHFVRDSTGLRDDLINAMLLTVNKDLLVGTGNGLCVFDDNNFRHIQLGLYEELEIRTMCQAKSGYIYIGTDKGLFLLNNNLQLLNHWRNDPYGKSMGVESVIEGPEGWIWLSSGGLFVLNPEDQEIRPINGVLPSDKQFHHRGINQLMLDSKGRIWIATVSTGLFICEKRGRDFQFTDFQNLLNGGFHGDQIRAMYEDRMGIIWVGAKSKGLNVHDSKSAGVDLIIPFKNPPNHSSDNSILAIQGDQNGNYYFGSRSEGLSVFEARSGTFTVLDERTDKEKSLNTNRVQAIEVLSKDSILIGTTAGLTLFSPSTVKFTHFRMPPVRSLAVDGDGGIWAGTSDGLIFKKNINTEREVFSDGQNDILGRIPIATMMVDKSQNLWVGTHDQGLWKYNIKAKESEWLNTRSAERNSFEAQHVRSFCEDSKGNIWVGTRDSGLYKLGEKGLTHYPFKMFRGNIRAMATDQDDNVWLVTHRNVFRLTANENLTRFGKEFGLYGIHAIHITPPGQILLGGDHRVMSLNPTNLGLENRPVSRVSIKSVSSPSNHNKSIDNGRFEFLYNEPVAIDFFIDDYSSATENQFFYQLADVHQSWADASGDQRVFFANLTPGDYTFRVKGVDPVGSETENIAEIDFAILPPWWLTVWAKLGYALVIVGVGYLTFMVITLRVRKRREVRKLTMEKEQSELLTQHKLRFFTNISHELRTPLTVMIPSAEKVADKEPLQHDELRHHGNIIKRSASTLLALVNELIEFKQIEEGGQKLAPGRTNISNLCSRIFDDLDPAAAEKNIDYELKMQGINDDLWVDQKIVDKVLRNLIFNAIKYTPHGGKVEVQVGLEPEQLSKTKKYLRIDIIDNGIGIADADKAHIFDRFYRSEEGQGHATGTGIGLDLVKNLVAIHDGTIEVSSAPSRGSHFTVRLPLQEPDPVSAVQEKEEDVPNAQSGKEKESSDGLILIVEDDPEILRMLRDMFSKKHEITVASNGKQGLEKALEYPQPNLIISDVMMPQMNGYQLCAEIKKNFKTSHIPVLLLTAKSSISDEVEGLESGANAYVTKPFYPEILFAKVDSLLKNQQLLKDRFAREAQLNPSELDIPDPDKEFLNRCVQVIEENMENEHFSVEDLGKGVGMSRTQLFRKLKYLVGVSASELIYSIRLKRAADMLKSGKFTVSEVAHKTGFSSPSSFSNTFRKHHNMSPREMMEASNRVQS